MACAMGVIGGTCSTFLGLDIMVCLQRGISYFCSSSYVIFAIRRNIVKLDGVDNTDMQVMVPARPETIIRAVRVGLAVLRKIGAVPSNISAHIVATRI